MRDGAHWLPQQVVDDFKPALARLESDTHKKAVIEQFLERTLPFRHPTILHRCAHLFLEHLITDVDVDDAPVVIDEFITDVGTQLGFFPARHYRMSHPFVAGLLDLEKRVPREDLSQYLSCYQYLVGWRGPRHDIESAHLYYEHVLDGKGALLHVAERQGQQADTARAPVLDIEDTVLALNAEAQAFDTLPADYSRVPNLKKKLSAAARLLAGAQALGSPVRSDADHVVTDTYLANEAATLAASLPIPSSVRSMAAQHAEQSRQLSRGIRLVRRSVRETKLEDQDNDIAASGRLAVGLADFEASDPIAQQATIRSIIAGNVPDRLAAAKGPLLALRGSSEQTVRRQLRGMYYALAKRNNPSPADYTVYPATTLVRWLNALHREDEPLADFLLVVWSTGIAPSRLLPDNDSEPSHVARVDGQYLRYLVLNHQAMVRDNQPPALSLLLPSRLADRLQALQSDNTRTHQRPLLAQRYRACLKALGDEGLAMPRHIATWRRSALGLVGKSLTRFDTHVLAGDIPFEDRAHSAYRQTNTTNIVRGYKTVMSQLATALDWDIGSFPDDGAEQGAVRLIGSAAAADADNVNAFLQALYRRGKQLRRIVRKASSVDGDATAWRRNAAEYLNLMAMNYALIFLAATGARPNSQRLFLTPWREGLRIEDKDSAYHTEYRALSVGLPGEWGSERTLLQQQRNNLLSSVDELRSLQGKRRSGALTIPPIPAGRWEPYCLVSTTVDGLHWARLSPRRFRELASAVLGVHTLGFRLNHFRHHLANIPSDGPLDDISKRARLGHTGPGLERWSEHCAPAVLSEGSNATQRTNTSTHHAACPHHAVLEDYGFRVLPPLKLDPRS